MSDDAIPYAEVIGDPIDQSLSPLIHGFWIEKLGLRAEYRRQRIERAGLADYLKDRRADPAWRGCNVTMPLKLDAVRIADESTDRAIGAGASNLLIPRDGKLLAGNTDVSAVMILVDRLAKGGAPMESMTLLGNGGAARAVLMALHLLGFHNVRIQSRDLAAAYKLAVEFGMQTEPVPFETPVTSDGLINATPLGMAGQPPLAIDWRDMPANGWIFDVVSEPTPLIKAGAERGLTVIDGIAMLVEQAAESFSFFFGKEPPRADDAELMKRLRT
jgi:shikimate dehydrogenase